MNFSLMYVHALLFHEICSLTYFHVKISVRVHEAENILSAFLAKKKPFLNHVSFFFFFFFKNQTYLLINKGPSCLFEKIN